MNSLTQGDQVSAQDWMKGISLSILASIIGGASKLAIRKSWIIQNRYELATRRISDPPPSSQNSTLGEEDCDVATLISLPRIIAGDLTDQLSSNVDTCSNSDRSTALSRRTSFNRQEEAVSGTPLVGFLHPAGPEPSSDPQTISDIVYPPTTTYHLLTRRKSLLWAYSLRIAGMLGMTIFNPLCSVLAMNYASPSILAPFSGLTLVWIVLFSPLVIQEQPTLNQLYGAFFIILGEVVVAVFGDHENDEDVTYDKIRESYLNDSAFHWYFFFLLLWMLLLTHLMRTSTKAWIEKFAWGVSGGSVTGLQNFLKDALTILKHHHGSFLTIPWIFFLFMGLAISSAFGGLLLLTACMKRYDATYSSASFVGSFVISASIMAAIHYDTFDHLPSITSYILYPTGLVILIIGVLFLLKDTRGYASVDREEPSSQGESGTEYSSMEEPIEGSNSV